MKKILYLEDEEVIGEIFKKKLEKAGYGVDWKTTSGETIKSAKSIKYNIVLLDQALKEEVSGMDIIPEIRKCLPKAKIIMLSNYSQFQMEEKAKKLGADRYLVKLNVTPETLVEYLKKL